MITYRLRFVDNPKDEHERPADMRIDDEWRR